MIDIKDLENLIQKQSEDLEEKIKAREVYYMNANEKVYITSLEDYIECKSCGYLLKSE